MIIENKMIIEIVFKLATVLLLFASSIEDFKNKKISIVFPVAELVLSSAFIVYSHMVLNIAITECMASFLPGIFMIMISLISGNELGLGDGLMTLAIGPVLGFNSLSIAIMLSFLFSSFVSIVLLLLKKVSVKSRLAFLPFFTMGVGVMCFATV